MKTVVLEGFSKYEILCDGRVRNRKTEKVRCDEDDGKNGYRKIKLTDDNGKCRHFWVARLIYSAFRGAIPAGMEIDHIDGDRLNNHIDNLSLVTHKQNCVLKKQRDSRTLFNRPAPQRRTA